MGKGMKKGLTILLIFISSPLEIVSGGEKTDARLMSDFTPLASFS